MKDEQLIHVKLEYEEAVQSKRESLSLEMYLLKILKAIKRYHLLRTEELKMKQKLYRKIKEINKNLKKLQIIIPKIKIPKILKKEERTEKVDKIEKSIKKPREEHYDNNLEFQLKEIREKLANLQ